MRWLANENFPRDAVDLLRSEGYDVAWVRTDSPGAADVEVLARAASEQRVLLTFDKDFGQLVFQAGMDATCGVVLFRISTPSSVIAAQKIVNALRQRSDWPGRFSTIEEDRIRVVELSKPSP